VQDNARCIEPGYDLLVPDKQKVIDAEVQEVLKLWDTHGRGSGRFYPSCSSKDAIADIQLYSRWLTRANEFDVIATLNLNGDYLSDALAAQVGGIGIAPAATSTMSPATPSSKPRMAPRPNMPIWTR